MGQTAADRCLETPPSSVLDQVPLATGSGADVFLGTFNSTPVALRRPRITSSAALARFEHEVLLRTSLSHPNVLPLIAASTTPPTYSTISPYHAGGSLFTALHASGTRFAYARVHALATHIASAMSYLHARNLVHRDLKTANILLDANLSTATVADLDLLADVDTLASAAAVLNGRAMHRGPSNGRLSHMVGTLVYLAPEVLLGAPHTFPADVYAFAVTVNELASATVPYLDRELPEPELHTVLESRFNDMTLRRAITKDLLRPVLARGVPDEFRSLISAAWDADPAARPTFEQILTQLAAIAAKGDDYLARFDAATTFRRDVVSSAADGDLSDSAAVASLVADLEAQKTAPSLPSWAPPPPETALPLVHAALSSTCGARGADRMEDTAIVCPNLAGQGETHLYAVFDGHAGASCAQYAAAVLPAAISRSWAWPAIDPASVLTHAFQDVDAAFLASAPETERSGCTALAALVCGSTLFVANAGDCRCVLSRDTEAVVVTKDHVATDGDERARVEARGGSVDVATGRVEGKLMVSRAMGDRSLKRYITATPDIFNVPLVSGVDFAVLATDGLWDVVSSEDAFALVRSTVRKADLAAKRLALKAIELGSGDNISVVVIFFDWDEV